MSMSTGHHSGCDSQSAPTAVASHDSAAGAMHVACRLAFAHQSLDELLTQTDYLVAMLACAGPVRKEDQRLYDEMVQQARDLASSLSLHGLALKALVSLRR